MWTVQIRRRGLCNTFKWKPTNVRVPTVELAESHALNRRLRHWIGPFQGIQTRVVRVDQ